jgi:hypothetical protein
MSSSLQTTTSATTTAAPAPPAPAIAPPTPAAPLQRPLWRRLPAMLFSGALARRRSVDSVIVGCLLTLLVISFDTAGWLTRIEFAMYDARAALFQFFLPRPTDDLMHLDLDDGVLSAVEASDKSRFPWPRRILAEITDEIALAKPKVVGFDIVFPEQQKVTWEPAVASTQPIDVEAYDGPILKVDDDARFSESLQRLGCALVPMNLPFERRVVLTDVQRALREELAGDVNLSQATLVERLRARGITTPDLPARVAQDYLDAWREQMGTLIRREVRAAPVALDLVKQRLFKPKTPDLVLDGTFEKLYSESISASHMVRFSQPIRPGTPALFETRLAHMPVPKIALAARYSANIGLARLPDGRVRALPMFVKSEDRMYPQMGLAMACAQLDVDMTKLRIDERTVVIPTPDGREIVIPHRSYKSTEVGEEIATFIDIPWWGGEQWAYMYDRPNHRLPAKHLSLVAVWDLVLTKRKIAANAANADAALINLVVDSDSDAAKSYAAKPPAPHDVSARRAVYESFMAKAKDNVEILKSAEPQDLDERHRQVLAAFDVLPKIMSELGSLEQQLGAARADMRKQLDG